MRSGSVSNPTQKKRSADTVSDVAVSVSIGGRYNVTRNLTHRDWWGNIHLYNMENDAHLIHRKAASRNA